MIQIQEIETEAINKNYKFQTYEKDFFSDNTYINMQYNETDIFKDKSIYNKYNKNKFENFKKCGNFNFSENAKFEKNIKIWKI